MRAAPSRRNALRTSGLVLMQCAAGTEPHERQPQCAFFHESPRDSRAARSSRTICISSPREGGLGDMALKRRLDEGAPGGYRADPIATRAACARSRRGAGDHSLRQQGSARHRGLGAVRRKGGLLPE